MALHIISPGLLTTVQDNGRSGYAGMGIQENGACDKYAARLANLLAGNYKDPERTAVIEFTLTGGSIEFTSPEVIAVTGADMLPELNGTRIPLYTPVDVQTGDNLVLGTAVCGLRSYLAVLGGVDVPVVMNSRSTNLKCGLGGFQGRALAAGDVIPTGGDTKQIHRFQKKVRRCRSRMGIGEDDVWMRLPSNPYRITGDRRCVMLRVVPGPQEEVFTAEGRWTFEHSLYRLGADCNRMANKLEGPAIEAMGGDSGIISDGIVEGSVQVSSNGMPIVMMADHQTTGGYAKIGTVISVDIPALAQLKPGDFTAFKYITPEAAMAAHRKEDLKLRRLREYLQTGKTTGLNKDWR